MQRSRDLPGAGRVTLARVCAGLALVVAMGGLVPVLRAQEFDTPPPPPPPAPAPKTGPLTRTLVSRAREAVQNLNQASANAQRQANPTSPPPAVKPAPAVTAAPKPGAVTVKPTPVTGAAATTPVATKGGPPVQLATSSNKGVTTVPPGNPRAVNVPKMAPQEERVTYQYNALGRRDPFQPLIGGGFVGIDVGGAAPPDVGGLKVVGIVWGAQDKFALVEDPRGNSMVLRKGDKVMNGVVEEMRRDGVVVKLTTDGQTQSVVIPLTQKGEQSQ